MDHPQPQYLVTKGSALLLWNTKHALTNKHTYIQETHHLNQPMKMCQHKFLNLNKTEMREATDVFMFNLGKCGNRTSATQGF